MTAYVKITTVHDRGDCNTYLDYVRLTYNIIGRGKLYVEKEKQDTNSYGNSY